MPPPAGGGAPPPPPPGPPPPTLLDLDGNKQPAGDADEQRNALFADLSKGAEVTKG